MSAASTPVLTDYALYCVLLSCSSPIVQIGTDNAIIFVRFSVSVLPGFSVPYIVL